MNSLSRSVTNSIKGRIWVATGALAMINCVVGLGAYLTLSFFSADPLLILFITFFLLSLLTVFFGWWLASEILRPVETVTLIAKSLERSPSTSLPRTTGAIETDQLLLTLHRSGQQLKNLISLMDDVSAGKIEAASMPLESSDKLSASFQKLVSKVTDSISAKRDLDEFRAALMQLSNEISGVRNGKLDISLRTDHPQTREVRDALRFLSSRLTELTRQVFATGSECARTTTEARAAIQSALEVIDDRAGAVPVGNGSSKIDMLLNQLESTIRSAVDSRDSLSADTVGPAQISDTVTRLRTGVDEAERSLQKLRSQSADVAQSARLAGDLANRSNLIALNASIVSDGSGATDHLVKEMESLSAKAEELHRRMLSSVESLNSEVAGFEKELSAISSLSPKIDKALQTSLRSSDTLVDALEVIGELENKIRAESEEMSLENTKLIQAMKKASDLSLASAMVRETESRIQRLSSLFDSLRDSVSDIQITASMPVKSETTHPVAASNGNSGFETFVEIGSQGGEN